jgi:hypothetical protein
MWINETVLCAAMCYRYGLAVPLVRLLLIHGVEQADKNSGGDQVSASRLRSWLLSESWPRFECRMLILHWRS